MSSLESFPFEELASSERPLSAALSESTSSDGSPPAKVEISSLESTSSDGSPPAKVPKLDISSSEGPPLKGKAVMHEVGIETDSEMHTEDSDPDDDDILSLPHVAAYLAHVEAHGGFDVPPPPLELDDFFGLIYPVPLTERRCQTVEPLCREAIAHFNQNENKQYRFVKLVKANSRLSSGDTYYITFEASTTEDGTNETFQAVVYDGFPEVNDVPDVEVYYCKREADFKKVIYIQVFEIWRASSDGILLLLLKNTI